MRKGIIPMRCQECGAEIMEGLDFCPKCDTPVTPTPPPKKKHTLLIIQCIALVLVLVGLATVYILRDIDKKEKSEAVVERAICEELTKRYVEFSFNGELDKILDYMPKKLVENAADEMNMTVQEMREYLAEVGEDQWYDLNKKFGAGWEYHFTGAPWYESTFHDGKNPLSNFNVKEITDDEFEDLKEQYDSIGLELEDARKVITYIKISGKKTSSTNPIRIAVITVKIDGKWYLGTMAK